MEIKASLNVRDPGPPTDRILSEFARLMEGSFQPDARDGQWTLRFGRRWAIHPNALRISATVRSSGPEWTIFMSAFAWPWEKKKVKRILDFRMTQLLDYLQTALRGSSTEPFRHRAWIAPFCLNKRPIAIHGSLMACFWIGLSIAAAMLAGWIAAWLLGISLISDLLPSLTQRARLVSSLGGISLPTPSELSQFGSGGVFSAAALFAIPIPFAISLILVLMMAVEERFDRLAGSAATAAFFCAIGLFVILFPMTSWPAAVAFSLLIPMSSLLAYRMVWARKGEHRSGPPAENAVPSRVRILLGSLAGVVVLIGALRTTTLDLSQDFIRLRDRAFLSEGRSLSPVHFYYRHAFYPAELIKPMVASAGRVERQQKTALLLGRPADPALQHVLRNHGFILNTVGDPAAASLLADYDLVLCDGLQNYHRAKEAVSPSRCMLLADVSESPPGEVAWIKRPWSDPQIETALMGWSDAQFTGKHLVPLIAIGFAAMAWALPLLALTAILLFFALMISMIYKRFSRRTARIAAGGILIFSAIVIAGSWFGRSEERADMQAALSATQADPPGYDVLYHYLKHDSPLVRTEAAYLLARTAERRPDRRPESVARLAPLLKDPDIRVRMWTARTLGLMKAGSAVRDLIAVLDTDDLLVQARAAEALGLIGDATAVEVLRRHLRSDPWYVGSYCLEAIRRLRP